MKVRASIRSLAKQPGSKVVHLRKGRDARQRASRPFLSSASTPVAEEWRHFNHNQPHPATTRETDEAEAPVYLTAN